MAETASLAALLASFVAPLIIAVATVVYAIRRPSWPTTLLAVGGAGGFLLPVVAWMIVLVAGMLSGVAATEPWVGYAATFGIAKFAFDLLFAISLLVVLLRASAKEPASADAETVGS